MTNDLVFCGGVTDLVLVDFIASRSIAIHVEDHWGAGNSYRLEKTKMLILGAISNPQLTSGAQQYVRILSRYSC